MIFRRTAPSETRGDSQASWQSGRRWVMERVIVQIRSEPTLRLMCVKPAIPHTVESLARLQLFQLPGKRSSYPEIVMKIQQRIARVRGGMPKTVSQGPRNGRLGFQLFGKHGVPGGRRK